MGTAFYFHHNSVQKTGANSNKKNRSDSHQNGSYCYLCQTLYFRDGLVLVLLPYTPNAEVFPAGATELLF